MSKFLIFLGYVLVVFSAFFVIAAVGDLISGQPNDPDPTEPGILIGLAVFFSLVAAGGVYMVTKNMSKEKRAREEIARKKKAAQERRVLELIARENGKVTPMEIARDSDLTIEEAKEYLDELCGKAGGNLKITKEGGLVYVFNLTTKEEKESSKDVLESYEM